MYACSVSAVTASDEPKSDTFAELGEHDPGHNAHEIDHSSDETKQNSQEMPSELGKVIQNLQIDLTRALKVLDLQEQLAMAWCSGHENNEARMDQIRATVDHSIVSGFGRCQQSFVLSWTAASMTADGLNAKNRDHLKHELRMCIKLAKTAALDTLDHLKMECFLHSM